MIKPYLDNTERRSDMITAFFGLNRGAVISENEFAAEENMSSDSFPLLCSRKKRVGFAVTGELSSLFSKEKLGYIKDGSLYYGGTRVTGLTLSASVTERQLVSFGAYLLIFPDKLYVNTRDLSDCGSLESSYEKVQGVNASFTLCDYDGNAYTGFGASAAPPEEPQNGALWIDTSVGTHILKQYSEFVSGWVDIESVYVKIAAPNIGKGFKVYDGVEISGAPAENLNGAHIIKALTDDSITVTGIIDSALTSQELLKVERRVPDMDFYCECGNRVWGCSSEKNEIYASKLGDASNWNCFEGISTDSFAVSVGTDGEFTGAVAYRGYAMFFKENHLHKIYGSYPPFTVTAAALRGVQKGSEKSLAILNETLYYKAPDGIMMYDGGLPVCISESFGAEHYVNACAGVLRDKYYICMSDRLGVRRLYTYDESRRIWHCEDSTDVSGFVNHNGNLFFIAREADTRRLFAADSENMHGNFNADLAGYELEGTVQWCAQTGLWGLKLPENKYYSGITIRFTGDEGAVLEVYISTNGGEWQKKARVKEKGVSSVRLPLTSPRCDNLRLKLCGSGKIGIMSIARTVEGGSGLNG